jgi:hypothetical protein
LQWFSGGVATGDPGSVTEVDFSTGLSATQVGNRLTVVATGGGGGSGTVTSVGITTGTSGVVVTNSPITTAGDIDLALGTAAAADAGDFLLKAANLSDLANALTARQNLAYPAGLTFRLGRTDGAVLGAGFQRVFLLPAAYDQLTTGSWEMVTFPSSTCKVDIQYHTFGNTRPSTADSIVAGTNPQTTGSLTGTGVTSGWTTAAVARGAYIAIQITQNDLAREVLFFMPGRRI